MISTDISTRSLEDKSEWISQILGRKNLILFLMNNIVAASSDIKLSTMALSMIADIAHESITTSSSSSSSFVNQLSMVESFWDSVFGITTTTEHGSSARCYCIKLFITGYKMNGEKDEWPPIRIFSEPIIESVFDIIEFNQSWAVQLNLVNLQILLDYLLILLIKRRDRLVNMLKKRKQVLIVLMEICAQLMVARGRHVAIIGLGKEIGDNVEIFWNELVSIAGNDVSYYPGLDVLI